jgi:RNA polymerase sigma factor (sigma-70 family)
MDDPATLQAFLRAHDFATLVTGGPDGLVASHVPILVDETGWPAARLRGHLARANPQWRALAGGEALAIFSGPHAYVSPAWYETAPAVPTWNYAAVHVYGEPRIVDERAALEAIVVAMVARYEGTEMPAWRREMPADFWSKMLGGIVGFEIAVRRVEGKWKLGPIVAPRYGPCRPRPIRRPAPWRRFPPPSWASRWMAIRPGDPRRGADSYRSEEDPYGIDRRDDVPEQTEAPLAALLRQAARGDQPSLALLYDRTATAVQGLVMRILRDPGMAEEVTADVYLQAWRQAASYDPARGGVLSWLSTLARSRALDRLRATRLRAAAERPTEPDVPRVAPGADHGSQVAERRRLVLAAVGTLPEDQRRVLELAYFRGLTHTEIAAELGEPLGTVKTRIRLGMTRLRRELSPLEEDLR